MNTFGRHLLVEYRGCLADRLDNQDFVEALMQRAAEAAGATIVQSAFHRFSPQGVSGVVVIQESHLSIHTWPEYGYAAVDFYTCGDCISEAGHEVLFEGLAATSCEKMLVHRGLMMESRSMSIKRHDRPGRGLIALSGVSS